MAFTKREKKEYLREQIVSAAKVYREKLAGRVFLYVYGEEYFEVSFRTAQFLHLTGVETGLDASGFYRKAAGGKLSVKQFYFSQKHPFATAKRKLPCLIRLPELTDSFVCVLRDHATVTLTYRLSVTNLEFTMGLTEDGDCKGRHSEGMYLPRTLRVNDKAVEQSGGGEVVDFIFVRDASVNTYHDLTVADSGKKIPESIRHLIGEEFCKGEK